METHAIDLDDEPSNDEDLGNGSMGNGHTPAEPMSEDRDPESNGADREEQPTPTNAGEGELFLRTCFVWSLNEDKLHNTDVYMYYPPPDILLT